MRTVLFAGLLAVSTLACAEDWWDRAGREQQERLQRERDSERRASEQRRAEQRDFERRDWEQKEREKDREAIREQTCIQSSGNWIGGQCFRFSK